MWILHRRIRMIRRSTAGSSWKVRRGHRENREFQVPMEQTGKPVICTSNIVMTVGRHSPGTVVRILALISEHAWTMQKMILQVSECISGRKSKARLEPKEIREIRASKDCAACRAKKVTREFRDPKALTEKMEKRRIFTSNILRFRIRPLRLR